MYYSENYNQNSIEQAPADREQITPGELHLDSFDAAMERVVDGYSRIGDDQYIHTKTHRGPGVVNLYTDEGSTHNRNFVTKKGDVVVLAVTGVEENSGRWSKKGQVGVREYIVTPGEDGRPNVHVSELMPRSEVKGVGFKLGPNDYVKEFSSDSGVETKANPEIALMEEMNLLTPAQQAEMDLVGYALQAVRAHLVPNGPLRPM